MMVNLIRDIWDPSGLWVSSGLGGNASGARPGHPGGTGTGAGRLVVGSARASHWVNRPGRPGQLYGQFRMELLLWVGGIYCI